MRNQFLPAAAFGTALGLTALTANAQVIINEAFINPPGGIADETWEYIELYGRPGTDLTGYAFSLINGGADLDGDNIPDTGIDDPIPEFDEAFFLDGLEIGPNGFFVLYNANFFGTDLAPFLIPNPSFDAGQAETVQNRPFINGMNFDLLHIPVGLDPVGRLSNDNSATLMLVRKRPNHMIDGAGNSVYMAGYAFAKDFLLDVNFDGMTDFGTETPIPAIGGAAVMAEPWQIVDQLAWSHNGGKEFVDDSELEISETPGFNPDAVSRLNYFLENPMIGHRSRENGGGFEILPTRQADEEWIYGEVFTLAGDDALKYDMALDADGFPQFRGPTDPNAVPFDGTCDPDPDSMAPDGSCMPNPAGGFFFTDLDLTGFALTPAGFNDFDGSSRGVDSIQQFRFTRGDFNFDGVVDQADLDLITARAGATLDDTEVTLYDNATPEDTSDDYNYNRFIYQGRLFQQTLMMLEMDMADGPMGENEVFVTMSDIAEVQALVPALACPGDCDDSGTVNFADLVAMLFEFGTPGSNEGCDADESGSVNFADLVAALFVFGPCP